MTLDGWLTAFSTALEAGDIDGVLDLFQAEGSWRDLAAFTWDIRTLEGRPAIRAMLENRLASTRPSRWLATEDGGGSEGLISFETSLGRGQGHVRLEGGRCATLLTALSELRGFEEARGQRRLEGTQHREGSNRLTWSQARQAECAELGHGRQPYVVVVGAGQAGLSLGARLRQLNVPTLIIDRWPRPGDQWRSRYSSLCLHDPVWIDHLPYLPFPDTWPIYTPKDRMADWLAHYASIMELNVWGDTELIDASFDETSKTWRVRVRREGAEVVLRPAQLVLATGLSGRPNVPEFAGSETFRGVQHHSSAHVGGQGYGGKRVVVIGSNNSAHDICADLAEHGADVTMVQRAGTAVVPVDAVRRIAFGGLYSEEALEAGITTEKADLLTASVPFRMQAAMHKQLTALVRRTYANFYDALEQVGFMLDFGEDGTGAGLMYLRRASGYYFDVGASTMIIEGRIRLRSNVGIDHIEPDGVVLTDGSRLDADVLIYATGFGPMEQWAAELISPEVAEKVGKVWGYGSNTINDPGPWEGELRNMWKPTRQDGLWFHGGNLAQARFYSRVLALQLKARHAELPVSVYQPAAGCAQGRHAHG